MVGELLRQFPGSRPDRAALDRPNTADANVINAGPATRAYKRVILAPRQAIQACGNQGLAQCLPTGGGPVVVTGRQQILVEVAGHAQGAWPGSEPLPVGRLFAQSREECR